MRNFISLLTFLWTVLLTMAFDQSWAQEQDFLVRYYLDKIEERDSLRFYGEKLYDYTIDKSQFSASHLISANLLYDISDEKFDSPSNQNYVQSIYNVVTGDHIVDNSDRLDGYRILGTYYHDLCEIDKSLSFYTQGLSVADTSCTPLNQIYLSVLYTNLSELYFDLEEFDKARLLIEKTIELDKKEEQYALEYLGIDYAWLAKTYRPIDADKSLALFLKGKRLLNLVRLEGDTLWDWEALKETYVSLADNYLALGNSEQALLEVDTALVIMKFETGQSIIIHGKALVTKASIFQYQGNYQEALEQYRLADDFLKKNKSAPITYRPNLLLQMARCYLAMGQPAEAQKQIKGALRIVDQNGPPEQSRLDKITFPKDLFNLYYEQAKIFTAQYHLSQEVDFLYKAQIAFQKALKIFEVTKQSVTNQESRKVFMTNNSDFFESAIDLNFQIWEQEKDSTALYEILFFSEKSKNNFLYEHLGKFNMSITGVIPDSILQQINTLDIRVSRTEKKLFQAQLADKHTVVANARDELIKYRKDQKVQMAYLEKKYPQYYQLKYHSSVPTVSALQENLMPGEGIISYYVGINHLYVLLLNKWDFLVERIPMDFSLSHKLEIFNHSILSSTGKNPAARKALQDYHETGFFLYQKLIAPFVRKLPSRLTILPDNVLENLSFDALLTELPALETPYQHYPFLLNKYTITYQYTAEAFCRPKSDEKKFTHQFLAFAPSFSDDQPFSISRLRDFGQLTHNGQEVDIIKKIIGSGTVLKNAEATEDNFMKLAPAYQIIHLATHGKVNAEHTDYSYLAFQEVKDSIENELLYIKDIYGLHLKADMVVLSACETANGSLAKGEGIVNLARGFTYAGASSVVPTLWKISDVATAKLMERFYLEIKSGQPKHIAMAKAKRHILETSSTHSAHPFYWAAFVLIGDVSPILVPTPSSKIAATNSLWMGMGTILLLFFIGLIRYFRSRSQTNV